MTASATARYITALTAAGPAVRPGDGAATIDDAVVTIVAMGFEGVTRRSRTSGAVTIIEHLLTMGGLDAPKLGMSEDGHPYDHVSALWECLNDPDIAKSLRGEHHYRPKEDIVLALQRDLFDFAMVGRLEDGHVRVTRSEPLAF